MAVNLSNEKVLWEPVLGTVCLVLKKKLQGTKIGGDIILRDRGNTSIRHGILELQDWKFKTTMTNKGSNGKSRQHVKTDEQR